MSLVVDVAFPVQTEASLGSKNKLFGGSNCDPLFTVYYQMLPALSQTAPSVYTLSYLRPPSMNRSYFAYVHSFRKYILSQVTDVLTSLGSYVIL